MAVKTPTLRRTDSLFAQMGGKAAIAEAVDKFYAKVLADPDLARFFATTNLPWLKQRQVQFLTQELGGPGKYEGRSMKSAHAHLLIEPWHFDRVATHLAVTLSEMGVEPEVVDAAMDKIATLEPEIVTASHNGSSARDGAAQGGLAPSHLRAMLENAPTNLILADENLKITYLNPASEKTLKKLERHLPVPVEKVLGSSIDIFHKNPAEQRKILSNPKNLPHRANIQIGDEVADLLVSAIYDERGTYLGPMLTWELVTEEVKTKTEMARVMSMMENAPINIMCADLDLKIQYLNPESAKTLRKLEQYLPVKVDQLLGQNIDIFHKNPAHQRKLLATDKQLPLRAMIEVGPEKLDLLVSAIYDQNKVYLGPMVTWSVVTQKLATENAVKNTAQALATASEEMTSLSQQMSATAEETSAQAQTVSTAAEQVSRNLQTVATSTEEMSATVKEIAKNTTESAKIASEAVKVAQETNVTVSKLGESSAEIGQVIKVITSIAQQTNLLALNATIEAARAGEAGKGFAVVANEVKELAKETAKATEDIGRKIEAIQVDTKGAVEAIGAISKIINQVNDISNTIATAVEEQDATTNEMTRNVTEAAQGAGEIAKNIIGVAQAAKNTSQGARDSQNAAQQLSKMAAELREIINHSADN